MRRSDFLKAAVASPAAFVRTAAELPHGDPAEIHEDFLFNVREYIIRYTGTGTRTFSHLEIYEWSHRLFAQPSMMDHPTPLNVEKSAFHLCPPWRIEPEALTHLRASTFEAGEIVT